MSEPVNNASKRASIKEKMPPAVRARMEELDMSVMDLARKINVTQSTLYNVLGGASEPSHRLAVKIAWGLDWTTDYFTHKFFSVHPLEEITENGKINPAIRQLNANWLDGAIAS